MTNTLECSAVSEGSASGADNTAGKTVLIVDDNEDFRAGLAELLRMEERGLTVHAVENGEQAASVVRSTHVDLVITDLKMPVMDGPELLLWMSEFRPGVPVIVVSSAGAGEIFDLRTRGVLFFDKPLDFTALTASVRSLLL
jgi:DNA-binding NtrC family response regulator